MTAEIAALYIASFVLLAVVVWRISLALFPRPSRLDHPLLFFFLISGALLVMRLPIILWPHDIVSDESQMVAQAMRFLAHPVPWRDVDGTTSGPLNSQLLSLPMYFGAPADWRTSRTVLWLFHCLTLILFYLTLRCFSSRANSQFALIPTILFYAFAFNQHYVHYSSETLPVVLISFGLYLLAREWNSEKISNARMFLIGCVAGAIPFAKLQGVPLAALLFFSGLLLAVFKCKRDGTVKNGLRAIGAIVFGGVLVPAIIMSVVISKGAFGDFWKSYILASKGYATQEPFVAKLINVWDLLVYSPEFRPCIAVTMVAAILFPIVCRGNIRKAGSNLAVPFVFILLEMFVTLFCIFAAGKRFAHYNFLLIPPLTILFGFSCLGFTKILESFRQNEAPSRWPWAQRLTAMCAVIVLVLQSFNVPGYLRGTESFVKMHDAFPMSAVVKSVREATQPGEFMSIWGWMPRYYVESGLCPGTRDAIGHYIISQGPYQEYFRARYLRDLEQQRPVVFVDAVAGGMFVWNWTPEDRHESFPALTKFIDDNYSLWMTISFDEWFNRDVPVRVYVLKERMAERKLSPQHLTPHLH